MATEPIRCQIASGGLPLGSAGLTSFRVWMDVVGVVARVRHRPAATAAGVAVAGSAALADAGDDRRPRSGARRWTRRAAPIGWQVGRDGAIERPPSRNGQRRGPRRARSSSTMPGARRHDRPARRPERSRCGRGAAARRPATARRGRASSPIRRRAVIARTVDSTLLGAAAAAVEVGEGRARCRARSRRGRRSRAAPAGGARSAPRARSRGLDLGLVGGAAGRRRRSGDRARGGRAGCGARSGAATSRCRAGSRGPGPSPGATAGGGSRGRRRSGASRAAPRCPSRTIWRSSDCSARSAGSGRSSATVCSAVSSIGLASSRRRDSRE